MAFKIDRGVRISISDIEPNPWNPNKTTDRQQRAIAESLNEYGQVLELLARPHPEKPGKFQIIDGEHRLNELTRVGSVFANVIHDLPDAEAKKLTIVMNETRGEADKIELATLLAEISDELGEQTGIGLPYDSSELEELIKLASVDWDNFAMNNQSEGSDDDPDNETQWEAIKVKIPADAMERVKDAYNLVEQQRGGLHRDKAIAWGQVIESLAADYLATPQ